MACRASSFVLALCLLVGIASAAQLRSGVGELGVLEATNSSSKDSLLSAIASAAQLRAGELGVLEATNSSSKDSPLQANTSVSLLGAIASAAQLRAGVSVLEATNSSSKDSPLQANTSGSALAVRFGAKPRPLAFKHLSKIAGTYIIDVLNTVMGKDNYHLVDEMFALTDARKGDAFVISSARNPCDYYVSLWAFDETKNFAKFSMQDGGSAFFSPGNDNATKFQNWVNWTQSHGVGIMSYRLYETLVGLKDGMSCWDQELGFCGEKFDNEKVNAGLAAFSPKATADCWIHTESLMDDLRRCLGMYEEASGAKIDWPILDDYDASVAKTRGEKKSKGNHNPSDHQHCDYYFDNATAASVMKYDRHLFEAFGYETCCGVATHDMK